jgi:hypothetical protein
MVNIYYIHFIFFNLQNKVCLLFFSQGIFLVRPLILQKVFAVMQKSNNK